jgi:phospholipid-binding lipoprotein MlaA
MTKHVLAKVIFVALFFAVYALPAVAAAQTHDPDNAGLASQLEPMASDTRIEDSDYPDPLAPFNERMFSFNMKLDQYVLSPVAGVYARAVPEAARRSVGRFFDNVEFLPRFANDLFQLKLQRAGTEIARFGINTTLGVTGLFDVANGWFGLKEHENDFGLTLTHYGVHSGPYLVLPFLGPSTVRDTIGFLADGAMNPLNYTVPFYVSTAAESGQYIAEAVNYRSLHLDQFEEADRYAIDLYGAVQNAYLESRKHELEDYGDDQTR